MIKNLKLGSSLKSNIIYQMFDLSKNALIFLMKNKQISMKGNNNV